MICLATNLLIALTPSTTKGDVLRPEDLPYTREGILQDHLSLEDWLLIEVDTLRAIKKDAAGYKLALEKLQTAQEEYIEIIKLNNKLQKEKHQLQHHVYELLIQNQVLGTQEWWQSPIFWAITSAAVGFIAGGLVFAYATGGL